MEEKLNEFWQQWQFLFYPLMDFCTEMKWLRFGWLMYWFANGENRFLFKGILYDSIKMKMHFNAF